MPDYWLLSPGAPAPFSSRERQRRQRRGPRQLPSRGPRDFSRIRGSVPPVSSVHCSVFAASG